MAPRPAPISRTVSVRRQPGIRGWRGSGIPTANSSNVWGTSSPSFRSPNGEPAENNRWNCPRRMKPTSPMLIRVYVRVGAGSLEIARIKPSGIIRIGGKTTCYHRASPWQRKSICLRKEIINLRKGARYINTIRDSLLVYPPTWLRFSCHYYLGRDKW